MYTCIIPVKTPSLKPETPSLKSNKSILYILVIWIVFRQP